MRKALAWVRRYISDPFTGTTGDKMTLRQKPEL